MNSLESQLHLYDASGNRLLLWTDESGQYQHVKTLSLEALEQLKQQLCTALQESNADSMIILWQDEQQRPNFNILERTGYESHLFGNALRVLGHYYSQQAADTSLEFFNEDHAFEVNRLSANRFNASVGKVNLDPTHMHEYLIADLTSLSQTDLVHALHASLRRHLPGDLIGIADTASEPHLVFRIQSDAFADIDAQQIKKIEALYAHWFPIGINFNWVVDEWQTQTIEMKTYERGAHVFTGSCGSGSACVIHVLRTLQYIQGCVFNTMSFDNMLEISCDAKDNYGISGEVYRLP